VKVFSASGEINASMEQRLPVEHIKETRY